MHRLGAVARLFARRGAAILAAIFVLALAAPAHAALLCGNFGGAPPGYQNTTGTAWLIEKSSSDAVATGVTCANSSSDTYLITQFNFAANWFAGDNLIYADLYKDLGGSSLETFSFSAAAFQTPELFTGDVLSTISLLPGESIYLALSIGTGEDDATKWGWQWNNVSASGYFSTFCPNGGQVAGDYCPRTGVTPVYDISYNVTGVPEPASLALFGVGLFGLAVLRRRRARS